MFNKKISVGTLNPQRPLPETQVFTLNEYNYPYKGLKFINPSHFSIEIESAEDTFSPAFINVEAENGVYVNSTKYMKGERKMLFNGDNIRVTMQEMFKFMYKNVAMESGSLPDDCIQKFFISRNIGKGSCGNIKLVRRRNGEMLAMKICPKKKQSNLG
jgi:hypothetical protein